MSRRIPFARLRPRRRPRRNAVRAAALGGLLAACAQPAAPPSALESTAPAWAVAAEAVLEVDLDRRTARLVRAGYALGAGSADLDFTLGPVTVTEVGVDAPPGLRRVRFALAVTVADAVADADADAPHPAGASGTSARRLVASSRIAAPPGQHGALVIPHAAEVIADSGRIDVTAGTTLTVVLPSAGRVVPSPEFDGDGRPGAGAPFAFFTSQRCGTARPDGACFRYETLTGAPGEARTVGFDVEPRVRRFRARLLVAGDLAGS